MIQRLFAGKPFSFWYRAARPHALGQSVMPYALGSIIGISSLLYSQTAYTDIAKNLALAVLGVAGMILAHLAMNLLDDYFDMKKGAVAAREEMQEGGMRARMGKCAYLKNGPVTLDDTRRVAIFFLCVALLIGAVILAARGWEILIFVGIALILGLQYAGPPLRLSYHGLAELTLGVIIGPVLVTASAFVAAGSFVPQAMWASVPVGLLAANLLNTHALMDFGPDKAANRKTLAVLLGSQKAGGIAGAIMIALAYLSIIVGVAMGQLPLVALAAIASLPLVKVYLDSLWRLIDHKDEDETFAPRIWMGTFGDWEGIQQRGVAWFMYRWMLARNIIIQVTIILALASLTPWYL